jgi:early secretory antigenic target protein ESAT-6
MSGQIRVSFGDLEATADYIDARSQEANQLLADLRSMLQPLVATWTGGAAESYNHKQHLWDTAAADINTVLTQISTALHTANANYIEAESANTRRWA